MAKVILCLIQFLVLSTIQLMTPEPIGEVFKGKKIIIIQSKKAIQSKKKVLKKYFKLNVKTAVECV